MHLETSPRRGRPPTSSKEGFEILADFGVVLGRDSPSGDTAIEAEGPAFPLAFEGEQRGAEVVRGDELPVLPELLLALAVVEELHDAVGIEVGVARLAVALDSGDNLDSPLANSKGGLGVSGEDAVVFHIVDYYARITQNCQNYFQLFSNYQLLSTYAFGADTKKPPLSGAEGREGVSPRPPRNTPPQPPRGLPPVRSGPSR